MRVCVEFAASRKGRRYDVTYGRMLAEPTWTAFDYDGLGGAWPQEGRELGERLMRQ